MRMFQFSDAKSHKFWNIDVTGVTFTVTYGKIGTEGQTQLKAFATAAIAQAEAEKLIRAKTSKGYVETTPTAGASGAQVFEKALTADPDDRATWSAYADYLTEQGDKRGEFMQVQLALEDEGLSKIERVHLKKREAALLKVYQPEWFGNLAPYLLDPASPKRGPNTPPTPTYTFRCGWLADLKVPRLGVEFARALVRTPQARLLRSLHVEGTALEYPADTPNIPSYADGTFAPGPDVPDDLEDSDDAPYYVLAKFPHFAAIRTFHLGNDLDADLSDSDQCHTSGRFAFHFLKQMPNVEEVYLLAHHVDAAKVFALPMPNLRVLVSLHGIRYPLDKLASNKTLSQLTHLYCHPHAMDFDDEHEGAYIRFEHLRAICRSKSLTNLTHLRLRLTDFGDRGAEEIVQSGLLKRLKVLDLQGGCITDEGAAILAQAPDLKQLEMLNLNSNAMSPDGVARLKATGVKLSAEQQHTNVPGEHGEGGDIPEYLYEGDIE